MIVFVESIPKEEKKIKYFLVSSTLLIIHPNNGILN